MPDNGSHDLLPQSPGFEYVSAVHPELAEFLDELIAIDVTHDGQYPLTIRHIARRIVPSSLEEGVAQREGRVFRGLSMLVGLGVLKAKVGPDSRTYDGGDPLPTYEFTP